MIVDPDFPDHWKTRMLVDALDGDEAAPVYLLRLWAHCQNRRTCAFENLPQAALKALCRFPGHANKLESSLAASGFVRREDQMLIVIGWEEYNASLIANWTNGKLGGRPKKEPKPNPKPTGKKPMGIPSESHGEPIREDRIREDVAPLPPEGDEAQGDFHLEIQTPAENGRILPENWKRLGQADQKRTRVHRNSPAMVRIGAFLNRRPDNLWTVAEAVSLLKVKPTEDEISVMEEFYTAIILPDPITGKNQDFRRRSLSVLLNNWNDELDKARLWKSEQRQRQSA